MTGAGTEGPFSLWPTTLGIYRYRAADDFNPMLARILGVLRIARGQPDGSSDSAPPAAFFASEDDLLERVRLPEWQDLVRFFVAGVRDTAKEANRGAWPEKGLELRVAIDGMWFQVSSRGASHDVHTHGNCSWCGVYLVQVDPPEQRVAHPVYRERNGVTRFYGPPFSALAGAHADLGNAYLQPPHIDVEPVAGRLVVFPSWLAHQALPYDGEVERIAISFNARIHAASGSDRRHGFSEG